MRHTDETESSLSDMLPTPRTKGQEGYETRAARKGHDSAMSYLESYVDYLHQQNLLPTPTAHQQQTKFKQGGTCLQAHMTQLEGGKTSQLNPRFVAEMMGFPPNWTELLPVVT